MDAANMFLIGGPAFSGTTLLTFLLNQGDLVCLDEPDFHKPEQRHRGVPLLRRLFPDRTFPDPPDRPLDDEEAVRFTEECARVIAPRRLGVKTCDRPFIRFAAIYRRRGWPVVAIVRDIRDALVRDLPEWVTEASLNEAYRLIWDHRATFDVWLRYEDLVADPAAALARIAPILSCPLAVPDRWDRERVHGAMLKLDRHALLLDGSISRERVGLWRTSDRSFSAETHETAERMGYEPPGA